MNITINQIWIRDDEIRNDCPKLAEGWHPHLIYRGPLWALSRPWKIKSERRLS